MIPMTQFLYPMIYIEELGEIYEFYDKICRYKAKYINT